MSAKFWTTDDYKAKKKAYDAARYQQKRDYIIAQNAAYAKANPQVIKAKAARFNKAHPESGANNAALRRAIKKSRTPAWLTPLHKAQIAMFYAAAASMTKETGVQFHVDHIIPLNGKTVSGLHVPWNLQVLTASDNAKKGNRLCK